MWAAANVISPNSQYDGYNGDGFSDVKYLESHDENRIVWAVNNYGSAGAQAVGGLQKAELGVYALMTCVGIPMIYNGGEIGSGEYRDPSPTIYKIDWAAGDADLRAIYRNLIALRLSEPALRTENIGSTGATVGWITASTRSATGGGTAPRLQPPKSWWP